MAEQEKEPQTNSDQEVGPDQPWSRQYRGRVKAEIDAINSRRRAAEARRVTEEAKRREHDKGHKSAEAPYPDLVWHGGDGPIAAVGLALSGGGVRSSAVCLGVLQALDHHHNLINRIDYLSTVSGGGYTGSSLTASMSQTGQFAFRKGTTAGSGEAHASEISDTPAVGHIRNYSNYLIPAGARDVLTGIAIVIRGLVANLSLTLPIVLALAALTILSNPARSCLYVANFFGVGVGGDGLFAFLGNFKAAGFTLLGAVVALMVLVVGGVHRLVSDIDRRQFFYYLAGIAFAMGLICNVAHFLSVKHFALTLAASLSGLVLFFLWAAGRSCLPQDRLQEFRGHLPTMGAIYLVLLGVIGFFEFQPFMIAQMFGVAEGGTDQAAGIVAGVAIGWIKSLAAVAAPVAAVVTFFRQQFADLMKGAAAADLTSRLLAYAARAAVWIAGLALPLLIWIGYLYLCYWGVANDKVLAADQRQCAMVEWGEAAVQPASPKAAGSLTGKIQFNSEAKTLSAEIGGKEAPAPANPEPTSVTSHVPDWLISAARPFGDPKRWELFRDNKMFAANSVNWPIAMLYLAAAVVLFLISWVLGPNANSLHRLYRDRLSKAFLFAPEVKQRRMAQNQPSLDQGRDFPDLDNLKLSELCPKVAAAEKYRLQAPYHLINTALNIQGSDYANRRGRNADFFLFSPLHVGSEATGYCDTAVIEKAEPGLDLATAMAISGAAASSNMGSSSIKALTPTLALLNVRLGYWLANPRYVDATSKPQHRSTPLYLWSEISGRLYENSEAVYLTDGGHIENLGIYELLRRRCKVIIVVDAEADVPMNFSSLMTLQRYARIDLGILIELPWTPIRTATLAWMKRNAGKSPNDAPEISAGPHVAIGTIKYGAAQRGYLVYIKSSLSGDENDYIRDYARRNVDFPHESTGDQFFSEEQFEVYRALGFHMTHSFLTEDDTADDVVVNVDSQHGVRRKFSDTSVEAIKAVREALGLAEPARPPSKPQDETAGGIS